MQVIRIRNSSDVLFGLTLIGFGAVALYLMADVRMGTATRMGPAYFPNVLGWLAIGFGVAIIGRGVTVAGDAAEAWSWRALLPILISVAVFALGIERLGLALTVIALTLVACAADASTRWGQAGLLAVALALFSVAVFVLGLGLPLPLLPAGMR